MTKGKWQVIKWSPEKPESVAVVVEGVVSPLIWQHHLRLTQLKRPYLIQMPGIPAAQIADNRGRVDPGFFFQFAKRGLGRRFTGLDGAFDQLHASQRVLEQQNARTARRTAEDDGAGLVG
ncbi:hypothetical protein D3C77_554370 [compost metagenome]